MALDQLPVDQAELLLNEHPYVGKDSGRQPGSHGIDQFIDGFPTAQLLFFSRHAKTLHI